LTQETKYPNAGDTSLTLKMDRAERFVVALRVPAWAGPQTVVRVNGKKVEVKVQPGTWAEVDRSWKDGDRIELSLDMPLRLVPLDAGHPNLVALLSGPVALFAIEPGDGKMTRQQLLGAERVGDSADWRVTGGVVMKSYPRITTERYRLYQEI
jgi:DUF1680 family protein